MQETPQWIKVNQLERDRR